MVFVVGFLSFKLNTDSIINSVYNDTCVLNSYNFISKEMIYW